MHDTTPIASPTAGTRLRHPVALFAVAAAIATVAAVVVGTAIGVLVAAGSAADCSPSDGWCELGAALVGLALGTVSGGFTYIVAGVVTIARYRPSGQRARFVAGHLALPPALMVVAVTIGAIGEALT